MPRNSAPSSTTLPGGATASGATTTPHSIDSSGRPGSRPGTSAPSALSSSPTGARSSMSSAGSPAAFAATIPPTYVERDARRSRDAGRRPRRSRPSSADGSGTSPGSVPSCPRSAAPPPSRTPSRSPSSPNFPKRHILALKAGFGGKTLLALTGTANPSYKERIGPLYADVHYVDPFAPDALAQIDALLDKHEFAVVQMELIQSVGGVRPIPEAVIRHLDEGRKRRGYLLLVDEVQTGMYRTGPFVLSRTFGLTPDLLLLGKGTSDMMFPFALTLYSDAVADVLERRGSDVEGRDQGASRLRAGIQDGASTSFVSARSWTMPRRVAEAGELFARLLERGPRTPRHRARGPGLRPADRHRARHAAPAAAMAPQAARRGSTCSPCCGTNASPCWRASASMSRMSSRSPPRSMPSPDEIRRACATIVDVLRRPLTGARRRPRRPPQIVPDPEDETMSTETTQTPP